MAKAPRLGAVKTRLGRDIGPATATRIYRTLLEIALRRLGGDPRWRTWIAVAPDSGIASPVWPEGVDRFAQGPGDLGARMQRIFCRLPHGPVIIVGCDVPGLSARHVADAFSRLGDAAFVLGPAIDGGYWLIGAKRLRRTPGMFRNVRWSSRHALSDTTRNLGAGRISHVKTLRDLDNGADYAALRDRVGRLIAPRRRGDAPRGAA